MFTGGQPPVGASAGATNYDLEPLRLSMEEQGVFLATGDALGEGWLVICRSASQAEALLDCLQRNIDNWKVSHDFDGTRLRKGIRLMSRVSKHFQVFPPTALFITNITLLSPDATAGGGYADIYKASYNGATVALKKMRIFTDQADYPELCGKFAEESLTWRQLSHPRILQFVGINMDTFKGIPCMVSPWLERGEVRKYLKTFRPSQRTIDYLSLEVAEGLEYLHGVSIVHGDLKSTNILIDEDGHACITDFGLAKIVTNTITLASTNPHGSIRWMAPELLATDADASPCSHTAATDIWAYACVVLELHTLKFPFHAYRSEAQVVLHVSQGAHPPRPTPEECVTGKIPDSTWMLMERCWEKGPSARPSAATVRSTLQDAQSQATLQLSTLDAFATPFSPRWFATPPPTPTSPTTLKHPFAPPNDLDASAPSFVPHQLSRASPTSSSSDAPAPNSKLDISALPFTPRKAVPQTATPPLTPTSPTLHQRAVSRRQSSFTELDASSPPFTPRLSPLRPSDDTSSASEPVLPHRLLQETAVSLRLSQTSPTNNAFVPKAKLDVSALPFVSASVSPQTATPPITPSISSKLDAAATSFMPRDTPPSTPTSPSPQKPSLIARPTSAIKPLVASAPAFVPGARVQQTATPTSPSAPSLSLGVYRPPPTSTPKKTFDASVPAFIPGQLGRQSDTPPLTPMSPSTRNISLRTDPPPALNTSLTASAPTFVLSVRVQQTAMPTSPSTQSSWAAQHLSTPRTTFDPSACAFVPGQLVQQISTSLPHSTPNSSPSALTKLVAPPGTCIRLAADRHTPDVARYARAPHAQTRGICACVRAPPPDLARHRVFPAISDI